MVDIRIVRKLGPFYEAEDDSIFKSCQNRSYSLQRERIPAHKIGLHVAVLPVMVLVRTLQVAE